MAFNPFDPNAEVGITERHLPHWFQVGAAIFVTFRTADSMPQEIVERWRRELIDCLQRFGLPDDLATDLTTSVTRQCRADHDALLDSLTSRQRTEFKKQSDRIFHRSLDECHGKCYLRQPKLAKIVGDAILHFDGDRYDLDRFVVMPNHVHAIVQFRAGFDLRIVSESWMRYSARIINRAISSRGAFWQPELFDHLIRSGSQFTYLQDYIADNPEKAGLREGESLFWQRE